MAASDPQRRIADRYRLESLLGRGGAGAVWLARDERLDRDVAVKEIIFPQGLSDADRDSLRARVLREARAAVRLDEAGAVKVYDVFDEGERAYLVMEVIRAPSLADLVREHGPLEPGRAAAIGAEVLATLEAAHAQGVVHRDVKPSNIIVPASGRVRLTDFGIASVQGDPGLTATGAVLGSPSYIAPEQARGARAGPAADLWGLGATLYFAVEGVSPFERDGALATVTAVVQAQPRPMARAGALEPVIAALLHKDPAARPPADRLRGWLRDVAEGGQARGAAGAAAAAGLPEVEQRPPARPPLRERPADPPAGTATGDARPGDVGATRRDERSADVRAHRREFDHAPAQTGTRRRRTLTGSLVGLAVVSLAAYALAGSLGDGHPAGAPATSTPAADASPGLTAAPTPTPRAAATPDPTPEAAETTGDAPEPTPEPTVQPTREPTPPAETDGPPPGGEATDEASPEQAAQGPAPAPDGWQTYTDDEIGYQVAYPPDWTVEPRGGTLTDFRDPETGTYLRVDWTTDPPDSPEGAWAELSEGFAANRQDYTEIRITPTTYRGMDAALWEYTYREGGADLHATNLGFTDGETGFALNFQTRAQNWESSQELYDELASSFRLPE